MADVELRFGQQAQHRDVILDPHHRQRRCPQRRDRHRPSVVGVVLVRASRAQQPRPRRQRRWHIDHQLTVSEQLLSEQIAEPGRRLDRPRALLEARCPPQQLIKLARSRAHHYFGELGLVPIDRAHRVECFVRIDPDHH
jgi:hypothetical protein